MNEREAAKFAATIKKQAWHQVRVKIGRTNGKPTFHIFDTQAKDTRLASTTIYTEGEWLVHPLNSINRPTKKPDKALDDFTNEFVSFTAGFQASMGRLTEAAVAAAAKMADYRVGHETEGA
jgi:hypothetical protein